MVWGGAWLSPPRNAGAEDGATISAPREPQRGRHGSSRAAGVASLAAATYPCSTRRSQPGTVPVTEQQPLPKASQGPGSLPVPPPAPGATAAP